MESRLRLSQLERRILIAFPKLFPDGDTDDLVGSGDNDEEISYAIQHLIGLELVTASSHAADNPTHPIIAMLS